MKKRMILGLSTLVVLVVVGIVVRNDYLQDKYSRPMKEATSAIEDGEYGRAIPILKPLAESNYGPAQYWLGFLYAMGLGVPQNDQTAIELFKKSSRWIGFCKLKEPASADAQAMANEFERRGRKDEAARWRDYASEMGYDAAICPVAK